MSSFRILDAHYETEKVYDGWECGCVKIKFLDSHGRERLFERGYKIGKGAHNTIFSNCHTGEDCIRDSIRWMQAHDCDSITDPFIHHF